MWAVADFPTPKSKSGAIIVAVFNMFPVYMNVLDAESGSCSKPETACCAATKALVVLTFKSRLKSVKERDSGCLASFGVTAAASKKFNSDFLEETQTVKSFLTIINDNAGKT